jgi:hypothetical protein
MFASDNSYKLITREINNYAEVFLSIAEEQSKINDYKNLTVAEMEVFLGISFHMGMNQMPHLPDY